MMRQLLTEKSQTNIKFDPAEMSNKTSISEVFAERRGIYLNEFNLYLAHFNRIPHFIHEIGIDCKKANLWFSQQYEQEIQQFYFNKRYLREQNREPEFDDVFYFLKDDLIVDFDTNNDTVRFLFSRTSLADVESISQRIKKFRVRRTRAKPKICLLTTSSRGFDTRSLTINKIKLNLEEHYNDDFLPVHETILKRLMRKNDKGLVLLHGKPGTGKTSYIRYLIARLKKRVIFLPPNMAAQITNPDLITVLIGNPNSVFVIEDAEHIVVDRQKNGNSAVSALLNISDGLLADCLNIQVVCSFNVDLSQIDTALMRKGRLIARYEFKELDTAKAQRLSLKLGYTGACLEPMTLAAIYNREEQDFSHITARKAIGFNIAGQQ